MSAVLTLYIHHVALLSQNPAAEPPFTDYLMPVSFASIAVLKPKVCTQLDVKQLGLVLIVYYYAVPQAYAGQEACCMV